MFAFAFDGDFLCAENIQFTLRIGLLIDFAAFCRRRYGIKNPAFSNAGFDMLGNKSVAVAGDANPGIFWRALLGLIEGTCLLRLLSYRRNRAHTNELVILNPPTNERPEKIGLTPFFTSEIRLILSISPEAKKKRTDEQ